MSIRIYVCPIAGDGLTVETAWRAKVSSLVDAHTAVIPNNADGTPKYNFALVVARAANWTNADADSTCARMFGIDLPDTVNTWADMKAFLQSKTVGDIPAARRQQLNTLLTNHGFDTSQVTLSTTWWQVLRGIVVQMGGSANSDGISIA